MSSCLVTTLKGVVDDDSLPYFGDLTLTVDPIYINDSRVTRGPAFGIQTKGAVKLTAVGGEFLSSTDLSSLGNEITVTATALTRITTSKETKKVIIHDVGYDKLLSLTGEGRESLGYTTSYSCGNLLLDLDRIVNHGAIWRLVFVDSPSLYTPEDFTKLAKLKSLLYLAYDSDRHVTAKEIGAITQLTQLTIGVNAIDGDMADFKGMTKLHSIYWASSTGDLEADLSLLPNQNIAIYCATTRQFTWKNTRSASAKPISLQGTCHLGNYIDAMLINQAQCSGLSTSEVKAFSLVGTRTSASDAAVATLQSNGWTITVTPES